MDVGLNVMIVILGFTTLIEDDLKLELLTDPYGKDSNQLVVISLNENRNSCSLITSRLTLFSLTVLDILKNLLRCSLGSSLGCLVN